MSLSKAIVPGLSSQGLLPLLPSFILRRKLRISQAEVLEGKCCKKSWLSVCSRPTIIPARTTQTSPPCQMKPVWVML